MITKERLKKLYDKGLSMMEIAERTGYSNSGIKYLADKYNILRRSRSEATYVKRNPKGDPFKIKDKLNKDEALLKWLGLGLYWGEGDKSGNTQIRISNTDPRLLQRFKEFLMKVYGVKKNKFKYSLVMFNDGDKSRAIKFWKNYFKISDRQLGKIVNIPPQGKGTYKKKNQLGVLTITVCNKKLKEIILNEIELI